MRPQLPPILVPQQPRTALAWCMQKSRTINGVTVRQTAGEFGCSASHISRVEQGHNRPSRELVQFYDDRFSADGLLLSLFVVVEHHAEQRRRHRRITGAPAMRPVPGDDSTFLRDTVPHGSLVGAGAFFVKAWWIANTGNAVWEGRLLERQGPITGPGLITSLRYLPVPETRPGGIAQIVGLLKAPTYACSSIAYFKMVHDDGSLCFPSRYQLGLDVLVRVAANP